MSSKNQPGFATFFKEDGLYYFQFNDTAGQPVLFSRGYQSDKSRDNGIKAVIRNASKEQRYETERTKSGKFYFKLKSGNHQEIARSPLFDSKKELEEKRGLLKTVQKDAPVFSITEQAAEKEPKPQEPKAPKLAPPTQRKAEITNMPRYKFSIIYYPGSDIWKIKHDLSGNAEQFKTCDGSLIERFLKSYLPAEETRATPAIEPTQKQQVPKAPKIVQTKVPSKKGIPVKKEKVVQKEIELKIHNTAGKEVSSFAQLGHLKLIEIDLKTQNAKPAQSYQAQVVAHSLEGKEKMVIGEIKGEWPKEGRIMISINHANSLSPGMYRFVATVQQDREGEIVHAYFGSRLVMFTPQVQPV